MPEVTDSDLFAMRGPIDGRKFFSQSAFRSAFFLVLTTLSLGGTFWVVLILCQYWNRLSSVSVLGLFIFACGFVGPWLRAFNYHARLRELYLQGSLTTIEAGSALDIALGVAAGGINDALFYCFATMLAMLGYIAFLLSHSC